MAGTKMASVVVLALCLVAGLAHGKLVPPQDDDNNWQSSQFSTNNAGDPMLTEGAGNSDSVDASGFDLFEDSFANVFSTDIHNPNLHQFEANSFDDNDQAVSYSAEPYTYDARSQETGDSQFSSVSGTEPEGRLVSEGDGSGDINFNSNSAEVLTSHDVSSLGTEDVGSDSQGGRLVRSGEPGFVEGDSTVNTNTVDSLSSYDVSGDGTDGVGTENVDGDQEGRLVGSGDAGIAGVDPTATTIPEESYSSIDVSGAGTEEDRTQDFGNAQEGRLVGTSNAGLVGVDPTATTTSRESYSSHDVSSAGTDDASSETEGHLIWSGDDSTVGVEHTNYQSNPDADLLAVEHNPDSTTVLGDPEVRDSTTRPAVVNSNRYTYDAHSDSMAAANQDVGTIFAHEAVASMVTDPTAVQPEQNRNPIVGPDSAGGAASYASVNPESASDLTTATTTPIVVADKSPAGVHGCPNSYWEAHTDQWPKEITTTTSVSSVFGADSGLIYGTTTFIDALLDNRNLAFSKLLRHAAAALLNAYAMPEYTLKVTDVLTQFQSALASDSSAVVQAQKFENANKAYGTNECAN